jgi:hypothetical protein
MQFLPRATQELLQPKKSRIGAAHRPTRASADAARPGSDYSLKCSGSLGMHVLTRTPAEFLDVCHEWTMFFFSEFRFHCSASILPV